MDALGFVWNIVLTLASAFLGVVAIYLLFTERMDFELNRPYQIVGLVTIFITLTHFVPMTLKGRRQP